MQTLKTQTVVIGAGVIGLAVARSLALLGHDVIVLEQAGQLGAGISSRNSEVIHGGLYYPPASLKATCCLRGKALLYDYCRTHGIAYRQCGKWIVAHNAQSNKLHQLYDNARQCDATGLSWVSQKQIQQEEPWLTSTTALQSAYTGIIDSHGLLQQLAADAEEAGVQLVFRHQVTQIECHRGFRMAVTSDDGAFVLQSDLLINAAGLMAVPLVQQMQGFPQAQRPEQRLAKGNYFSLQGKSPTRRLIYPLPAAHGLGVHLTIDLQGQARFGPDVEWVNDADFIVNAKRVDSFTKAISDYWPNIRQRQLQPAYAGIRPKLYIRGEPYTDFLIQDAQQHGIDGLVNLLGIESPGLTAALALAEKVAKEIVGKV